MFMQTYGELLGIGHAQPGSQISTIFVPAGDVRVAPLILVDLIPIWSAGKNAMV
jgi:hypothetical protein